MLLGANNNEGQTFLYDIDELPAVLFQIANVLLFGKDNGDKVNAYYNDLIPNVWEDGRPFMSQVLTDFWFRCASEQWATSALKQGVPAYFYRYSHVFSDGSVFSRFGLPAICANVVRCCARVPAWCGADPVVASRRVMLRNCQWSSTRPPILWFWRKM
jgi:hypothetical protein